MLRKSVFNSVSQQRFFNSKTTQTYINKVFPKTEIEQQIKNELLSEDMNLKHKIETTTKELESLLIKQHSIQHQLIELNQPNPTVQAQRISIQNMQEFIIHAIKTSILEDKQELRVGPLTRCNKDILNLFQPILYAYGITFYIINSQKEHESGEYFHLNLPKLKLCQAALPSYQNKAYQAWVNTLLKTINTTIKTAEEAVEKDFLALTNKLYARITEYNTSAYAEFKAHPAAHNRFEQFAEENDMEVTRYADVTIIQQKPTFRYTSNRS